MRKLLSALVASMLILGQAGLAGPLQPVDLDPITHAAATLTVVAPDGTERSYTPAELEAFPTYALTTTTPWRQEPAASVERGTWTEIETLVATRVNGRAHGRRSRGPIQFIIDMDTLTATDLASESTLVWMAARIEAES